MAKKASQFAEAVVVIKADDKLLIDTLKKDERIVEQSVQNMQGDLDTMKVSVADTGAAAGIASTGVTALGAAATATGSAALSTTTNVAALGIAASTLGSQALGAAAQMKVWGAAMLTWMVTPIGLFAVAAAAVVGVIALGLKRETKAWNEETERANQQLERLNQTFGGLDAHVNKMRNLREQVRLLQGGDPLLGATSAERELRGLIAGLQATKQLQAVEEARAVATHNRITALRREMAIIRDQENRYRFIEDSLERQATRARDKAMAERDAAVAMERQAQAAQAAIQADRAGLLGGAPQTANQALTQIRRQLAALTSQAVGQDLVRRELERQEKLGNITAGMGRLLATAFGLSTATAGGAPAGGGIAATAFPGGPVGTRPGFKRSEGLEEQRTKDLKALATQGLPLLERIFNKLGLGGLGEES